MSNTTGNELTPTASQKLTLFREGKTGQFQ